MWDRLFQVKARNFSNANNERIVVIGMFKAKARLGNVCFSRPGLGVKVNIKSLSVDVHECQNNEASRRHTTENSQTPEKCGLRQRVFRAVGECRFSENNENLMFNFFNRSIGTSISVKSYFNKLQLYLTTYTYNILYLQLSELVENSTYTYVILWDVKQFRNLPK